MLVLAVLDGDMIDAMAYSRSPAGSKCLVECFNNARGDEFRQLRDALLGKVIDLSTGEYRCVAYCRKDRSMVPISTDGR